MCKVHRTPLKGHEPQLEKAPNGSIRVVYLHNVETEMNNDSSSQSPDESHKHELKHKVRSGHWEEVGQKHLASPGKLGSSMGMFTWREIFIILLFSMCAIFE